MKAVLYEAFSQPPKLTNVPDPAPEAHGVVVRVEATGVCRSDWHCWVGHDNDITLPHVPGHELAGVVEAVGRDVRKWKRGDRVTVPFVHGCGECPQSQPGFTHWGSFAEFVSIHRADLNLVALPETLAFDTAASLGCRFATSFRAVVDQGRTRAGQWVAVHGCGGVGLSAVMIANALGANVIGVDIADDKLALARELGAVATINANAVADVAEAAIAATHGGAHVSIDALGALATCFNSVSCLRKRGRHIQVGLLLGDQSAPRIPMSRVVANELELFGSHGMQAHRYGAMLAMVESGKLRPERLIGERISLEQSIGALMNMDTFPTVGVSVVTRF
jgi:alcohol dehydrogenase